MYKPCFWPKSGRMPFKQGEHRVNKARHFHTISVVVRIMRNGTDRIHGLPARGIRDGVGAEIEHASCQVFVFAVH